MSISSILRQKSSSTARPPPLTGDLELLTTIRFFAALWVFSFHFWSWLGLPDTGLWRAAGSGARGVDLFFVLSGFVIFHVYGQSGTGRDFNFAKFMWRRFARVYPLHFVLLLVWLVFLVGLARIGVQLERSVTLWDLVASVLLIQSWHVTDGLLLNGVAWSVSAEMTAYLSFGLLMSVSRVPPGWKFWSVALATTAIVAHLVARSEGYPGFMHPTWDFGALRILPSFALGVLTRMVADHVGTRGASIVGGIALIGLFFVVQNPDAGYVLLPLFAGLILAAARLSHHLGRMPGVNLFVYLGEISYSTYMVHTLILLIYSNAGPRIFGFWDRVPMTLHAIIVFLIILAASSVSYHLIEKPARNWLNRRWSRRETARAASEGTI
ncbi:Peptidoglycan/LPS O-acetylase OafA/YrhL, contains acyltransferase and SGNH-hydrolase domains [Paracoccus seriniphilus]|uniref:Peptidoglycan/LPS O-acetylase OafA/YrhL, contains acyltransferase and SGNH-hydrolase domains n=1 Tax=Paracoccus seriniphilus TaxID=184748 RepID=A0A239PM98_9RHOB|nr:Peptidoglycan/LPS O-acetylase OafA/YrhL, contains acyltransferase and SGNH-hydrolase domains [Paracoccus seriniphilus]